MMNSKLQLNLVVSYADGREDVYLLSAGQSTLGRDDTCEYGIQADGVAGRHVLFLSDPSGTFAVNLQEAESVRLNGAPLDGRRNFEIGDELAIGSVLVRLQPIAQEGENLADSPDGVASVAESVRRDAHSGWRGYRKVLEKIAPFISSSEAETAECLHRSGHRALLNCLLVVLAATLAAGLLETHRWFLAADICRCACAYFGLICVLVLTVRYRIRCAGRLFALLDIVAIWQVPPSETWVDYFEQWSFLLFVLPVLYLAGWGRDVGADCLFHKRHSKFVWRYLVLLLSVGLDCAGFFFLNKIPGAESPLPAQYYFPLMTIALLFPLWGRLVPRKWSENELDVSFIVEQASQRMWRRWIARALAVLAVGTPLLYLLSSLGMGERLNWRGNDDLVITENGNDEQETLAWYWFDRGRYLRKDDFKTELIYQVPYEILLDEFAEPAVNVDSPSNEDNPPATIWQELDASNFEDKVTEIREDMWARSRIFRANRVFARNGVNPQDDAACDAFLDSDVGKQEAEAFGQQDAIPMFSNFGESLCRKIAKVQVDATNTAAFAELRTTLAPYRRATVPDAQEGQFGGPETLFFYLDEFECRGTYSSGSGTKLHHAQVGIGVQGFTQTGAKIQTIQYETIAMPILVLLVLGGLLLWKRGADSSVGFWLGIAMTMRALALFYTAGQDSFGKMLEYPLWRWAVESSSGGLVAGWVATLNVFGAFFDISLALSQSILFILLCWPSPASLQRGWLRRSLIFVGKFVVVFAGLTLTFLLVDRMINSMSYLVVHIAGILVFGIVGGCMRRKRRFDTEAPELGWIFLAAWLMLECARLFWAEIDVNPWLTESWLAPIPHLPGNITWAGLVSGMAAVVGGALFLCLCLKRNFLAVLTVSGFTFTLFSFAVPLLAAIGNTLVGRIFAGSFLQSARGERIVAIAVVVLVMRPLWNVLGKLSKRLSVRNLGRVETGIYSTLETVLDRAEDLDVRDEIFTCLAKLGIERYAFFARSSPDAFHLILKNDWNAGGADSFQMSPYLRFCLGRNPHALVLNRMEQDDSLFFQSFELCRLEKRLHASCLLPICLGKSVRGVLVTPDSQNGHSLPQGDAFFENVNALGLATVESLGHASQP